MPRRNKTKEELLALGVDIDAIAEQVKKEIAQEKLKGVMKMRLIIDVSYKYGTITEKEARDCLTAVAFDSASKGLFTGPGPGEVEDWEYRTEVVPDEPEDDVCEDCDCDLEDCPPSCLKSLGTRT